MKIEDLGGALFFTGLLAFNTASAAPKSDDIVGLRTGMSAEQAMSVLMEYRPKLHVEPSDAAPGTLQLVSCTEKCQEKITVDFTANRKVFAIKRVVQTNFKVLTSVATSGVLQKYGQPTVQNNVDKTDFTWAYDADKAEIRDRSTVRECDLNKRVIVPKPPKPKCGLMIKANVMGFESGAADSVTVSLEDYILRYENDEANEKRDLEKKATELKKLSGNKVNF